MLPKWHFDIFDILGYFRTFLDILDILEQKCTFEQKVLTWRPLVAIPYKHNDILMILNSEIAEMSQSAYFLDFCPQSDI